MLGRLTVLVHRQLSREVPKSIVSPMLVFQRRCISTISGSSPFYRATRFVVATAIAGGGIWLNTFDSGRRVKSDFNAWTTERTDSSHEAAKHISSNETAKPIFSDSPNSGDGLQSGIMGKIRSLFGSVASEIPEGSQASSVDHYRLISLEEFRADHNGRVWIAWHGGVYDMTDFMAAHPGGPGRIAMVEGQDLSKFWDVYKLHHRKHIAELMKKFRIGTLSPEDFQTIQNETHFDDPYAKDPARKVHERARIASTRPWNFEPPLDELQKHFITPNELFFVRNHNPVPDIDPATWSLTIGACPSIGIHKATQFSYDDLRQKLPRHEVLSTLQCAGNRQRDYIEETRPLYVAPSWENGAIGNARWVGVRVRDLLRACGADVDALALGTKSTGDARIVNFVAEDVDETGLQYASILPIEKVLDPWGDVIMAYEMNGEPLPRDHGFPLRLVAPGTAGCRNAKWVSEISVSDRPTELDSGSTLDRHFSPAVSFEDHRRHCVGAGDSEAGGAGCGEGRGAGCGADPRSATEFGAGPVIQSMPVTSVLTSPARGASVEATPDNASVPVKGLAWSGAGRGVVRVEVSTDGGETFRAASILPPPEPPMANGHPAPPPEMGVGRSWAWVRFEDSMPLADADRALLAAGRPARVRVCSKAVDGDFNSQPERMRTTWNTLGICANHYSCADVTVTPAAGPRAKVATAALTTGPPDGPAVQGAGGAGSSEAKVGCDQPPRGN